MKKIFLITALIISSGALFAQTNNKKGLQKVTFGAVVPIFGSTTLTSPFKPFTLGYNLLPNLCLVSNKTYHNFLYGTGNNVLKTIQGYKVKKDLGVYLALQKSLTSKNGYVGIGIEKFIPVNENLTFFLFSEIGVNHISKANSKVFTLGIHINVQSLLWKK